MTRAFYDVLDRSNTRGYRYRDEAGDLFIRKVQIMMHAKVDNSTLERLYNLALTIESIKDGLKVVKHEYEQIARHGEPRHKFIIADRWDPRKEWIRMTVKPPKRDPPIEEDEWNEFLEVWEDLVVEQGRGKRWYEVDETKWFIPVEQVKQAFKVINLKGTNRLGI
ncbi:hypothetical protein ACHAPT_005295 [Fusarium lateritium]